MQVYSDSPNADCTTYVEYPRFLYTDEALNEHEYDPNKDNQISILNAMINGLLKDMVMSYYFYNGFDSAIDQIYQCAVTLNNGKAISIVFWGDTYQHNGRHDRCIQTMTIELTAMRELRLTDIFRIDDEFEEMFFGNAVYPVNPETTLSTENNSFSGHMKYLRPDIFRSETASELPFYLKPEGAVLVLPELHAGGDHFEAQIDYTSLTPFCLLGSAVWD
jgi:hypothetical protein